MAGMMAPAPEQVAVQLGGLQLARQQMRTIAWLRWRIFTNGLRRKGATGELVAKILAYLLLAVFVLAPSVGTAIGSWYLVLHGMGRYLPILLWVIFAIWQLVGLNTSTSGPSFDLSSLIRFPIRYRDYLLVRLSFGLMDPPTLIGAGCLVGMSIGLGVARPLLFPWAALVLVMYGTCNIFFSRMIYAWMERWLAQRRTRELVTALILLGSLGLQVGVQFVQRTGGHGKHAGMNPVTRQGVHWLVAANWFFPPGLTGSAITHMHPGAMPIAFAALAGLLLYTGLFLFILHARLFAEYSGENLSEAPGSNASGSKAPGSKAIGSNASGAAERGKAAMRARPLLAEAVSAQGAGKSVALLSTPVAALLVKEARYLMRSGPKLFALVMPVFMVFIFSARSAGLSSIGVNRGMGFHFLFSYMCVYLQLILMGMMYNSLGSDGLGVQFYFIAPVRMRQVLLAKNLLTGIVLALEAIALYVACATLSRAPAPDVCAASLGWLLFASLLNLAVGNYRSIVSPKAIDPARMRRQHVSGFNTLISFAVTLGAGGIGAGVFLLSMAVESAYWLAGAVFLVLSGVSMLIYRLTFTRLDRVAIEHREDLLLELTKA